MPLQQVAAQSHNVIEIGAYAIGFLTLLSSQIVGSRINAVKLDGLDKRLEKLGESVEKINGNVDMTMSRVSVIEGRCEERHGKGSSR